MRILSTSKNWLICALVSSVLGNVPAQPSPDSASTGLKVFKFPDGSAYRGEIHDGKMHGQGEWRSAEGDSYVGSFENDVFEGPGIYTESTGNSFVGTFRASVYAGPGCYQYSDGRAELGTYVDGKDVGQGVRFSTDRTRAWRLMHGEVRGEITPAQAEQIAMEIGIPVPPSLFSLPPEALERMHNRIKKENDDTKDFDTHLEGMPKDLQGVAAGDGPSPLVAHSKKPLISPEMCGHIIRECEDVAAARGGWTTQRHAQHPTTDISLTQLPGTIRWFQKHLLPEAAFPFLASVFRGWFPASAMSADLGSGDIRLSFRVTDAFVAKYNASSGQHHLLPHRDGSVFTFNVALNDAAEYEGGGTNFSQLGSCASDVCKNGPLGVVRSPQGHVLAHSSALMHGGHPIESGCRYLLIAFVTLDHKYKGWATDFYEHVRVNDVPDADHDPDLD